VVLSGDLSNIRQCSLADGWLVGLHTESRYKLSREIYKLRLSSGGSNVVDAMALDAIMTL
jgi:hypothetical protein